MVQFSMSGWAKPNNSGVFGETWFNHHYPLRSPYGVAAERNPKAHFGLLACPELGPMF